MNLKSVRIESKRADEIKIGDYVVFMPLMKVAQKITGIKKIHDEEAALDRVALETIETIETINLSDNFGWEPWRMFTVVEIEF